MSEILIFKKSTHCSSAKHVAKMLHKQCVLSVKQKKKQIQKKEMKKCIMVAMNRKYICGTFNKETCTEF